MKRAVAITQGAVELEASGNIGLENIRSVADTGVDYISIGALTKISSQSTCRCASNYSESHCGERRTVMINGFNSRLCVAPTARTFICRGDAKPS